MKKILLTTVITLSICFGIVGCQSIKGRGKIEPTNAILGNKYFDLTTIYDGGAFGGDVVYDKNTNVMYFIMYKNGYSAITPIYNSDGSVKLYEGGD